MRYRSRSISKCWRSAISEDGYLPPFRRLGTPKRRKTAISARSANRGSNRQDASDKPTKDGGRDHQATAALRRSATSTKGTRTRRECAGRTSRPAPVSHSTLLNSGSLRPPLGTQNRLPVRAWLSLAAQASFASRMSSAVGATSTCPALQVKCRESLRPLRPHEPGTEHRRERTIGCIRQRN
jgi:hypothetical protein